MPNVVIEKNWPVKGLCGRCFICLRPPPLLWPHSPPFHTVYVYSVYLFSIHTWKGGRGEELTRKKVREAIVHKAGRKYQHDWLYLQSINQKRIWCLYSYLVHARRLTPHLYPTSEGSSHAQLTHSFTTGSNVTVCMYIQYVNNFKTCTMSVFQQTQSYSAYMKCIIALQRELLMDIDSKLLKIFGIVFHVQYTLIQHKTCCTVYSHPY
jgi:hypothetical protein